VILAMGIPPAEAVGSVRLTLGRSTTNEDVVRAADALARAWHSMSGRVVEVGDPPQSPRSPR
jgi:cysteine desulfurase